MRHIKTFFTILALVFIALVLMYFGGAMHPIFDYIDAW